MEIFTRKNGTGSSISHYFSFMRHFPIQMCHLSKIGIVTIKLLVKRNVINIKKIIFCLHKTFLGIKQKNKTMWLPLRSMFLPIAMATQTTRTPPSFCFCIMTVHFLHCFMLQHEAIILKETIVSSVNNIQGL